VNATEHQRTSSVAKLPTTRRAPRVARHKPAPRIRPRRTWHSTPEERVDVAALVKRVQSYLDVGRT